MHERKVGSWEGARQQLQQAGAVALRFGERRVDLYQAPLPAQHTSEGRLR